MHRSRINKTGSVLVVSFLAVGLTACGGSDNDSASTGGGDQNSTQISTSAIGAISSVGNMTSIGGSIADSSSSLGKVVSAKNRMVSLSKKPANSLASQRKNKIQGLTIPESTVACSGGGSITYGASEFTDVTDYSMAITFNSCVEGGEETNGTASFTISSENSMNMVMTDLTMLSDDEVAVFDSATFVQNGSASSFELTGYFSDGTDRVDFKNYKVDKTTLSEDPYSASMILSGSFKTSCDNSWYNISTSQAMLVSEYEGCPTAGRVTASGGGSSMSVTYNSDQSIDVSTNGSSQHYDNCTDLDPASGGMCQ